MKANTAGGFVAAGLALAFAAGRGSSGNGRARTLDRTGLRFFACATSLLGLSALVEYIFRIDLRVDELLFIDPTQWPFPGRMSPLTAGNFLMAGVALFLRAGKGSSRKVAQAVALLMGMAAFAGIIGYLYGVPVFYGAAGFTAMAFHTGLGFLVLSFGMIAAQPDTGLAKLMSGSDPGNRLFRRIFPMIVFGPVALGWLYLRPAVNFGHPSFSLALFAVTLVLAASTALWYTSSLLNREEDERREAAVIRERSTAAVRRSERELRLVTDHLPVLLSYIDVHGAFLRVNRTYEEWLGLPASEIVGRTATELLGEAYWDRTLPARHLAQQGRTAMIETLYPTVHGDRRAQVTYAPDTTEAGEVRGFACMVVDIEDHRRAESALRQSEKLAVVGRLASSIAHEINNPLEAVTNLLYIIEQDTAALASSHQYVLQAQEELARVTHIVVETLRFHRQATHPTLCHVSVLIGQVLALYRGRLLNAGIEVELRCREQLPVLCREGEIRQVLANLIGNAIDAMSRGGRLLIRTCNVASPLPGKGVVITVADTGHGIKPETLAKIFEPFYTTKGATGSGLGLWISKEIVERHHGSLHVRSRRKPEAGGTVFRVMLSGAS